MKLLRTLTAVGIGAVLVVLGLAFPRLPRPSLADHFFPVVRASQGCSLESIHGNYAVEGAGTVVSQLPGFPPPPAPFGVAAIAHFNGDGTASASVTANIGGLVLNAMPVTATYTVNNDCTGAAIVYSSVGLTLHETIVIISDREFITTETDPFAVIQRRAYKILD